jgi:hypothetical protein
MNVFQKKYYDKCGPVYVTVRRKWYMKFLTDKQWLYSFKIMFCRN